MATKTILPVALFFQNPALIEAIAVALAFPPESAHTQCLPSYRTVHTEGGWSRQDMLTLASVCLAIVGIMIGALMASPKAHCTGYLRKRRLRRQDDAHSRLHERYNDFLRFQEYLELVGRGD
ncbi:hypothetical protein DDE82_007702 [Stemphylium lycopersici]|nr:hypothetical protein TW65_08180 [Stemphylium lycopersici]RAQ99971.1 hypothetical protein DDE82_007702 [Stemphylium lycopersici]